MSRSYSIGTEFECLLEKDIELYLAVAEHIGVGCSACLILGKHIVHDPLLVLLRQIYDAERNIEALCHKLGKYLIVVPWTVALESTGRVVPITHKQTDNLVTLLLEQPRSYR